MQGNSWTKANNGVSMGDMILAEEKQMHGFYGSRYLIASKRVLRRQRNSLRRIADKRAIIEGVCDFEVYPGDVLGKEAYKSAMLDEQAAAESVKEFAVEEIRRRDTTKANGKIEVLVVRRQPRCD